MFPVWCLCLPLLKKRGCSCHFYWQNFIARLNGLKWQLSPPFFSSSPRLARETFNYSKSKKMFSPSLCPPSIFPVFTLPTSNRTKKEKKKRIHVPLMNTAWVVSLYHQTAVKCERPPPLFPQYLFWSATSVNYTLWVRWRPAGFRWNGVFKPLVLADVLNLALEGSLMQGTVGWLKRLVNYLCEEPLAGGLYW